MRSCSRQKYLFINNAKSGKNMCAATDAQQQLSEEAKSQTFNSQVCTAACRASSVADLARINSALRNVDRVEL